MKTLQTERARNRAFLSEAETVDRLQPSTNSKVDKSGSLCSFGILPHIACPGRTVFCSSCYVASSYRYKNVPRTLARNTRFLFSLQKTENPVKSMATALESMVERSHYYRTGQFRIHWSGDYFSPEYFQAWNQTIRAFRGVQFWTYTRSFRVLERVRSDQGTLGIPRNLSLFLSADSFNFRNAIQAAESFRLPIALASKPEERESIRKESRRLDSPLCPVLSGSAPDCFVCGRCQKGRPVWFREHR